MENTLIIEILAGLTLLTLLILFYYQYKTNHSNQQTFAQTHADLNLHFETGLKEVKDSQRNSTEDVKNTITKIASALNAQIGSFEDYYRTSFSQQSNSIEVVKGSITSTFEQLQNSMGALSDSHKNDLKASAKSILDKLDEMKGEQTSAFNSTNKSIEALRLTLEEATTL